MAFKGLTLPDSSAAERRLKTLFERGLDGDETAYRRFLCDIGDLLRKHIKRQLYRFRRAESDAEDIVQEVLLALHAKRHVYDRDVPITAWAHAIARYRMIDFLRVSGHAAQNLSLEEIDGLADATNTQIDLALSLREMIADLPERLRRPIELMKLRGFSARETASMTRTSEASVKVNVHRGLRALARAWSDGG
jgi:RNA polymerase sigma-70 factor (ECF subfamily)